MHGHITAGPNSYCANLACSKTLVYIQPDPSRTIKTGVLNVKISKMLYYSLLKSVDILLDTYTYGFQVKNRVAHYLSGTVISDIPSTVDTVKLCVNPL